MCVHGTTIGYSVRAVGGRREALSMSIISILCRRYTSICRSTGAIICALAVMPSAALAADAPAYGPVPAWVVTQQAPGPVSGESGVPLRVLLTEVQVNLAPTVSESYFDNVLLIQTPQGLAGPGNIALSWRPETDLLTVHKLTIVRAGKEIDVLGSGQTFSI